MSDLNVGVRGNTNEGIIFFSKKDTALLTLFVFLFIIFSVDVLPSDIVLALICFVFVITPLRLSLFLFMFFSLWENVTVFSFGITLNLIFLIVASSKIVMDYVRRRSSISFKISELFFCGYVVTYGVICFFAGNGTFSGIGMAFVLFIALNTSRNYPLNKGKERFWQITFFMLMLSTFISVFYGLVNNTSNMRWISGMGYIPQLYGTVGTARIGMFLCASLIYPMFYIKRKLIKTLLVSLISFLILMTLSITALITYALFWLVYAVYYQRKNKKQIFKKVMILIVILLCVFSSWKYISSSKIVEPILIRTSTMVDALYSGDMDVASSSRYALMNVYVNDFQNLPILNQIVGSFYINRTLFIDNARFSHNSYVDLLLYMGYCGLAIWGIFLIARLLSQTRDGDFLPIVLLKLIFFTTGLSVSMLSSTFWLFWVLL